MCYVKVVVIILILIVVVVIVIAAAAAQITCYSSGKGVVANQPLPDMI